MWNTTMQKSNVPMFHSAVFESSNHQVEEVPGDFQQSDLATDDVMLLDTWDQVSEAPPS